jgi:probable F420-dependent oxidoreductase
MQIDVGTSGVGNHLAQLPQLAQLAEEIGFAGLWTNETRHDSFLPLVLAAEHSGRMQLGTSVAIAFARSPMVLAQTAWDIQAFSGGRLLLGLGTQVKAHIERRFSMPWDAPVARLREYIAALRTIWTSFQTSAPLRFEGAYYRHTLLTPFFNPGPIQHPTIPVSIAGVNTGLARLAGEVGDGFHIHPLHSVKYVTEVARPAIARGAAQAGRDPDAVELVASVFVVTGDTPEEVERSRAAAREQISFYASTPTYRPVLTSHGWDDLGEALSRLAKQQRWREMPGLVSDDVLRAFAVEALPFEVGPALLERYRGVVDRITLYQPFVPGERDAFWRELVASVRS